MDGSGSPEPLDRDVARRPPAVLSEPACDERGGGIRDHRRVPAEHDVGPLVEPVTRLIIKYRDGATSAA